MADTNTSIATWVHEQGERDTRTFPVLDDEDGTVNVDGWTVDAQIKSRPGGTVLYTFPAEDWSIDNTGLVILTIPGDVEFLFRRAWYRVRVLNPDSPNADEDAQRVLAGPFINDPG